VNVLDSLPLCLWLTVWRCGQRYHRYTVEGLEHLDAPRSALIVGYHGRPFAFDLCMLSVTLYDRLGYLPHGVVHRGTRAIAPLRWLCDALGFVTGDDERLAAAVARGEHIMVTPGGAREGCRSFRNRYRVSWGERLGYLRTAVKYGLSIVPVAAAGADWTYIGLNDAEFLGRRLGLPSDWAWLPWLGVGPFGLFPFSPPFPVRLHQMVGEPIAPHAGGTDREALLRLHRRVTGAVQALLDRACHRLATAP
jgi:acyltransferase-like protein